MDITTFTTTTTGHVMTLHRDTGRDMRCTFSGRCSCGAESGRVTTAGMVHGWHAAHLDAEGDR